MLILVSGGSASGKSEFAESLVLSSGCSERYYLATMIPFDEECHQRIARHRKMRAAKGFSTIETPTDLAEVSFPTQDKSNRISLLECMSNLVANEIFSPESSAFQNTLLCEEKIMDGIIKLCNNSEQVIIVTNELFSDGISYDAETNRYLQVLGKLNQRIAEKADYVYEVVAGIPICWKGENINNGTKKI